MGIFLDQVEVVNRAPVPIDVTFDGQAKSLQPGKNIVPKVVVSYAKNQNPVMGTQSPYDPHISGCETLIGVVGTKDNIEPLTPEEWESHLQRPCREDEQQWFRDHYGTDPKARLLTFGKGKKTSANSRYDAGILPSAAEFSSKS